MFNRPSVVQRSKKQRNCLAHAPLAAAVAAVLPCLSHTARAYDVSAPAILQDFESSYTSIANKMPDIFESGYGGVYLPPPGITLNGESVGYDVYDRFNLGSPGETTLYGTQAGFESVVKGIHTFGGSAYADLLWTWTNGINNSNNSSFSEFPGLATVLQTTNPKGAGYNTLGYNTSTGDFYPTSDTNQDEEALAGLQHNDPTSNFDLIRQPTTAGNPQNIPEGTGIWLGTTVANVPTASNAQYYPDQSQGARIENDPTLNMTNIPVYSFNTSNPMAGTPVAENALGYLMRYTQWMVQAMGVDGFRFDGGNNTYPWVMNYLDLATYDMSNRLLLNGQQQNVFTFSEVFTSNVATIQQYISKSALSNPAGTVGGDRDALDFPLYFSMTSNLSGNGTFGSGQNNWNNVVKSSLDFGDDGLLNGSSGVKFVSDQDVPAPVLSNVAYAYTLMLPGNATVNYNGQNFGNESSNSSGGEFPQGGASDSFDAALTALGGPFATQTGTYNLNPLGGGATTPNGNIATLVDLRNRFGRGNYREDWIEQNVLAYERVGSSLVLLSNATSSTTSNGDFDSRTFATQFPAGTILEEYTGNAASTFADPQQNIPQFVTVFADSTSPTGASVSVRVPRNVQFNTSTSTTYATGDGYLVYGLPTPTGTLNVTNIASTMAGQTFSPTATNAGQLNGTDRFTNVSVIKASSFQLQLSTTEALLNVTPGQPLVHDQNADGDNAQFTIDGGAITVGPDGTTSTTPGSNGETTTPGNVSYGYQNFASSSPGYTSASGNGSYSQTINTAQLGQGYHYIEVIAFRHSTDVTAPPVYSDWYETVYVDTTLPLSTLVSFNPTSTTSPSSKNRTLVVQSSDGLANNTHVFLDLPSGLSNAQVLAMVGSANQPAQTDVNLWQETYTNLSSGNHVATIVSFKPDGTTNVQRFDAQQMPFLSVTGATGAGVGDLNGDSQFTSTDVTQLGSIVQGNGTTFTAAGDINGDGLINLADLFLMGPLLTSHNATAATMSAFTTLTGQSYVVSGTYNVTDSADVIYQDTAATTNVQAGNSLTATSINGSGLSIAAGAKVIIAALNSTPAATSRLSSLTIAGSTNAWTGKLDLQSSDLLLEATPTSAAAALAQVTDQIKSGFDNGKWDGQGITSSASATDPKGDHTLGVILNSFNGSPLYTTFDGQSVDTNTILIKYTYYGDANLDGQVNGSDYTAIDNGFNEGLTGWNNGDFNYDGVINGDDYALIDNAFNMVGSLAATPQDMVAADTDQISPPPSIIVTPTAVPEPSTLGLFAAATAGLLVRRQRKQRLQT
jgi:alpha-amylase